MPITKATASSIAPAAKGDLVVGSATNDAAVLGVGSADQVLTVDSSTTTGLKWATPAAGGMTLISETVANSLTSLTLGSIPGTYKQLLLVWNGIVHSTLSTGFSLRINNSADASKYPQQAFRLNDSAVTSSFFGTSNVGFASYQIFGENVTSADIERSNNGFVLIDNYASTTRDKFFNYQYAFFNNTVGDRNMAYGFGRFDDTTAITSLDIYRTNGTGSFSNQTNTSIRLYGIA